LDFGETECDYSDWMLRVQGSDQTTGKYGKESWCSVLAAAPNLTTFEGIKGRVCTNDTAVDLHSQAIGFDSPSLFSLDPPLKLRDHDSN